MSENNSFNVSINDVYFVDILKNVLKEGQEHVAECLGSVITSDSDKEAVFKAVLGIKPELNYAIDDLIYIDVDDVYLYGVDKEATKKKFADNTGYVPAVIVNIRPYHREVYRIKIKVMKETVDCYTTWIQPKLIQGSAAEDFPDEQFL